MLLLKLSRVGPGRSLDGRPDAAGSGVGGQVGGTLSSGRNKISLFPRAVIGDIALCRVPSLGGDVNRGGGGGSVSDPLPFPYGRGGYPGGRG